MNIFHNDKLLILDEKGYFGKNNTFGICIKNREDLINVTKRWLSLKRCRDVVLYGGSIPRLTDEFKKLFIFVEAAGGVVKNNNGRILFIKRWDMWDLPKGKMERGETPEQTALREVKEETGLTSLKLEKKLAESYHIYYDEPPYYLKRSHWFAMTTEQKELTPQSEEEITEATWLDKRACEQAFSETYRTLRDVLQPVVCNDV